MLRGRERGIELERGDERKGEREWRDEEEDKWKGREGRETGLVR